MILSSFEGTIVPEYFEGKYFSIIFKILLEPVVRVPSSESDLNVLFIFFGVRRVDFGVFGASECSEEISW